MHCEGISWHELTSRCIFKTLTYLYHRVSPSKAKPRPKRNWLKSMSNREINQSQNNKRGVCCHVVLFTLRDSFIPVIIDRKEFAFIYLSLYSFYPDYHLIMLMIVFLTVRIQMQTCQIFSDWKNICVSYQWYKHHISHKYFKNRYSQPCSWKWIINVIKERQEEKSNYK